MHHIEILVEDSSGGKIVNGLMKSILSERTTPWTFTIRRHRGIGKLPVDWDQTPAVFASGLFQLLPAKLRVYARAYQPSDRNIIIVVFDTDYREPRALYRDVINLRRKYADGLTVVIGIAVEELEAWLLGDRAAVLAAYPDINTKELDAYEQDSVVGTWEVLASAILGKRAIRLIKAGYPAVGSYKHKWAEAIAPHLDAKRNISPSFRSFYEYLLKCLNQLETGE